MTTAQKTSTKLSAKERRELERRRQQQQQTILLVVVGVVLLVVVVGGILLTVLAPVDAVVDDKVKTAYSAYDGKADYMGVTETGYYYLGAKDAPITVEEFSSLSCPHCYDWHRDVFKNIQDKIQAGQVKFVYIPLTNIGSFNSEPMAKANICAGEQGKFWEMQDVLFDWQARYGTSANDSRRLSAAASALGLDTGKFDTCVNSSSTQDQIKAAADDATKRGVNGTPTIFVNGENIGTVGLNELRGVIESKVAEKAS
ncbi:MAG: DsbA family protein [Anaerolineae bacterium]|nr:DsbA family protein [Anaerolineae bacterium]